MYIRSNQLIETASVPVIKLKVDLVLLCKKEKANYKELDIDPNDLTQDEET